jgi:hypothetical protein
MEASCKGKSYGLSCKNALWGQASMATQMPSLHRAGWHLLKSMDGTGFMSIVLQG